MPKVASLFGLLEQLDSSKITVNQSRCVLVRNRNAECLRCLEACTTGCISYDEEEGEVRVSSEKCIGCGACATACPTGALLPKEPDDARLFSDVLGKCEACDGHAVVVCDRLLERASGMYDPGKVTSVACLGRIDEGMILALAAKGAKAVTLVHEECGACEHSQGMETVRMVRENADVLLETWGSDVRLKVSGKIPSCVRRLDEAEFDEGRRAWLKGVKDDAAKTASTVAVAAIDDKFGVEHAEPPKYVRVGEDGVMPQFVPDRRRRLNAALEALGEPADVMIDTRLWGHVVIDEQLCSSCRMCATFCPTGALRRFDESEDVMGVTHSPSLCVKCRMCENICPEHAIELSELVFAVDMLKDEVDRYEMKPLAVKPNSPKQIHGKMKTLIHCDQIYER